MKYIYEESDIKAGLLVSNGSPKMVVALMRESGVDAELFGVLDLQTGKFDTLYKSAADDMAKHLTGNQYRPLRPEQVFNEEEY
jgi:hypothetical protein